MRLGLKGTTSPHPEKDKIQTNDYAGCTNIEFVIVSITKSDPIMKTVILLLAVLTTTLQAAEPLMLTKGKLLYSEDFTNDASM